MRAKSIDGEEADVFSKNWRRWRIWHPGQIKKVKRKFNKRQRQDAKRAIRNEDI